ncbi:MAG TPA: c-type cytochrome [Ignavibacteriaceae bacterium]|jgi:mono/diheme cytochrome c family protein|nr:c-type cytochrome [Ignavibacteriaceae bacterium]
MIKKYFLVTLSCFLTFIASPNAQNQGEQLFKQRCTACHTVGGGKLIGPDLANVQVRRTEEWIIKFVQSSQSVIKSGDTTAVAVFNQHNKVVMPDQDLNDNQIKSIVAYIAANSPDVNNPNVKTPLQIFNAASITAADIENGKNLFEGLTKLTNGGPACISCHNINNQVMFNGGLLAKDLTTAFSRLSAAGVDGILRNPPFPAMVNAFGSAQLTDQEVKDILAFLYYADSKGEVQLSPLQTQFDLLIGIIVGINIALGIFFFMWQRVKKYSVNFFNN